MRNRVQVTNQDTYDYSTPSLDVVARPTDPYVAPATNTQGQQLVSILQSFQTGIKGYADYREVQNKEDEQQGVISRAKGETPLENKTKAFIKGWEELDGELRAKQDYYGEVNEYYSEHKTDDKETFQKGLQQISQKYLGGMPKEFQKGFVTPALKIEDAAMQQYSTEQNVTVQAEKKANATDKVTIDTQSMIVDSINSTLSKNTSTGSVYRPIVSLGDMQNDPALFAQYLVHQQEIAADLKPKIRKYLTDTAAQLKSLGLTTKDVSGMVLNEMGTLAENNNLGSGTLDYTDLKDIKGIAVSDTELKEDIRTWKNRADAAQNQAIRGLANKSKQDTEDYVKARINDLNFQAITLSPKDPNRQAIAKQLLLDIRNDTRLKDNADTGELKELVSTMNKIATGQPLTTEEDRATYLPLLDAWNRGQLTYSIYAKHMFELSEAHNTWFADEFKEQANKQNDKGLSTTKELWSKKYSALVGTVTRYDKFNNMINPTQHYAAVDWLTDELELHGSYSAILKDWDNIEKRFQTKCPASTQGLTGVISSTPSTSTPKSTSPSTPSKPPAKKNTYRIKQPDGSWKEVQY